MKHGSNYLGDTKFYLSVVLVFIGCMLIATAIELAASYILEAFTGKWLWQTYARDYKIHFQGRIALSPSIRFGIGGVIFLYLVQPLFDKILHSLKPETLKTVFGTVLAIISVDCIYTFVLK